jgi:hypothetical protein
MAPELWVRLVAKPDGARPIETLFAVRKDGPASITLPVLQPIRGREKVGHSQHERLESLVEELLKKSEGR